MFLNSLSQELIARHGKNLARTAVIFPNKRASLWMNDLLLEAAGGSVFAPRYYSISEFFQQHCDLVLADRIQLVSILHKTYCKITGEQQTLDQFYAWGEILLNDFDNVDKSLADAEQLFRNVSGLHEMDSIDFLSDHQKEMLERFFNSFTRNHESRIQQKFIALWNNLLDIYTDFRAELRRLGIAYEGMIYREVAENASYDDFKLDAYYAVGLNRLLKCEERLFLTLADKLTIKNDEASIHTVSKETKITIAQALTDDLQTRYIEPWLKENDCERLNAGRRTAIVLCDENLLPTVTYCLPGEKEELSLPLEGGDGGGAYNITAGFPLAETQPASYIATLFELYTEGITKDGHGFRRSYLRNLESHPLHKGFEASKLSSPSSLSRMSIPRDLGALLASLSEAITAIAASETSEYSKAPSDPLLQEATFRVYQIINRLRSLHEQGFLDIEPLTLSRLYKQIVQSATIPFHGEPAKGVQIMGVLETRNLDFDHILMLSCNEGNMPQGASDVSAIPYTIKRAFDLNTADDRTDIYAYHFYRLLKHCKDITFVYNASSSDTSPGEMSRFLLNLIVNNPEQITRIALRTSFQSRTRLPQPQEKLSEELHQYIIHHQFTATSKDSNLSKDSKDSIDLKSTHPVPLSPSAINTYLRCEKLFYYQYYRHLREEKDEEDETMDSATFGTFFHAAAELFYKKLLGQRISADMLQQYIDHPDLLEPFVQQALVNTMGGTAENHASYEPNGLESLLKSIVAKYMVRLLKNDARYTPFTIVSLEEKYYKDYTVTTPEGDITMKIGGAIDRLDRLEATAATPSAPARTPYFRVVDYKTGADHSSPKAEKTVNTVDDMFDNAKEGAGYYRQACLYSIALADSDEYNPQHIPVSPALYYIRNKALGTPEGYDPTLTLDGKQPIADILPLRADYERNLHAVLHDIFNKKKFDIPADLSVCNSCPFAELCKE